MFKFLTSLFSRSQQAPQAVDQHVAETSMNFDSENVRPFLETLNSDGSEIVPLSAMQAVDAALSTMAVDETRNVLLNSVTGLRLDIFLDDIEAPDLYFYGPPDLIAQIDQALLAFATAMGL